MKNHTPNEGILPDPVFSISFFEGKLDVKPRVKSLAWSQLRGLLSDFAIREEKDGPLFSPARFSPARRAKKNVVDLSLLVLDYDHDVRIIDIQRKWGQLGYSFLIYSTHSHQRVTDDHPQAEDRFRVVIPLKDPISVKSFPFLWSWAKGVSGGCLDESCKDVSRMYYLPAISTKNAPKESFSFEGNLLDWRLYVADEETKSENHKNLRLVPSPYAKTALKNELDRILSASEGGRNNALNKAAFNLGQLVAGGMLDESEVVSGLLDAASSSGLKDSEAKATINSGLGAGKQRPRKEPDMRSGSNEIQGPDNSTQNSHQNQFSGNYEATESGLVYYKQTKDGELPVLLTNFSAQIVADVVEDDGAETRRSFELQSRLNGRTFKFLVSADDFNAMKWPMVNLGAKAVIYPRYNDHARCAIQVLSDSPDERRIYTHTGWRKVDDEIVYLHGGGGIGANSVKNVEVRLPDSLSPAIMPEPPGKEEYAEAMSAILELANLAADEIMLPVIGAAFSSVIGQVDFSIWLYGPTGSGKSELAALIQSFFGRFNSDNLPGSWMSTANALEAIAHAAKDMIFVVDDFKPAGSAQDRARLNRDADRLLRAQGNQQGRQRLAADTSQRMAKFPRGLIFNTAEEVPRGESLVARLFVIECHKTSIDFSQLTKFQKLAQNRVFATAMSGFLRWLAIHYARTIDQAPKEIAHWRDYWAERQIAHHRRFATTLGHLTYAWSLWMQSASDAGALSDDRKQNLWDRVIFALGQAGAKQDSHTDHQNPVTRFNELLSSAFASHKAHLGNVSGGMPVNPHSWGWRDENQPGGDCVGWHTGEEIYLLPDPTFALLERFAANGEGVGVQQTTLWKHLYENGVILFDTKRNTYKFRRKIQGREHNVLVLRAEKLSDTTDNADISDIEGG